MCKAKFSIESSMQSKFCKARSVPFSQKKRIEDELDCLLHQGVIEPIQYSEWAAPIVLVMKPDGSIRIYGNYKLTINKASRLDFPKVQDLLASQAGGQTSMKLDLSHAYL